MAGGQNLEENYSALYCLCHGAVQEINKVNILTANVLENVGELSEAM